MSKTQVSYVELFWDCPECGQPHISAVFNPNGQRCPGCFYWREEDDSLYEAPDSQTITDPTLIDRPPQWVCKACGALNPDTGLPAELLQCGNCDSYQVSQVGGITGEETQDQQAPAPELPEEVDQRSQIPESRFENPIVPKSLLEAKAAAESKSWLSKRMRRILLGGAIGLGITGTAISGLVWFFQPHVANVQIKNLTWTVTTPVEQYRPVERSTWADSIPTQATVLRRETKVRSYRQVQQGYRTETYRASERYNTGRTEEHCRTVSKGNGVGEKRCTSEAVYESRSVEKTRQVPNYIQVPVSDTWVTYRMMDWVAVAPIVVTGKDDDPRPTGKAKLPNSSYQQRQLAAETECIVEGVPASKPDRPLQHWSMDCKEYDQLEPGTTVPLEIDRWGGVRLPTAD